MRGHDEEVHDFTSHSVCVIALSRCSRVHNLNITYTHSPSAHCSHIHTNATTSCTCSRESAHGVRVPCACASSRWCADGAPLQHVSMNSDDSNVDAPRHHRDRSAVAPFHRCRSCACVRASILFQPTPEHENLFPSDSDRFYAFRPIFEFNSIRSLMIIGVCHSISLCNDIL